MTVLALTMGDPAGIGGELALDAWQALRREGPAFVAIDDPDRLAALAAALRPEVPIRAVASVAEAAALFPRALPVLPEPLAAPARPGRPDPAHGSAILAAIRRAVALALSGEVAAVVTNPIAKTTLFEAGLPHAGHTSWLAELAGGGEPVMMLASPTLRVVPVTVHIPLAEVPRALTAERIVSTARITAAALAADFGVARPRLAVAGLNPHAGESGTIGEEEEQVIRPAIASLRAMGLAVSGPHAADSLFHERARQAYDAALCMYHDQALIPVKTLDFSRTVNVTLGLPIVRTSPDHGTAYDIAGRGEADPASLIAALRLAAEIAARRRLARAA
ncbi:MAG: 4-hydroxythreonine-4-phosphate dehydrogenase PdxA [Elioraea sp.]|nr:4-hydroxythreonine-4-phosphate dehydrogenase PdxA [Elioraea sp.]MDW8445412.1 4-hydroxythreonine-4-phosphate dehydrogenase PdxA [Acetobacteraceae bacterium]